MDTDATATVIIGQRVREGLEQPFQNWQRETNAIASTYAGFLGAEVNAPTGVQPDWVVIYRFDSVANVSAWINSAARQDRLEEGQKFLDGPPTQQVLGGRTRPSDQLVTVVVTHRVSPPDVEDFLAWQHRLEAAESAFKGYRGSELFRPIEGVQDKWTAMYRYDNAEDLETWLTSDERKRLLAEGAKFRDFELHKIDSSFGSWFAFNDQGAEAPAPSPVKTSIAVWVGLYPTVMFLTLALAPAHMHLWLSLLIGNLLSSFVMSFVTMPYYVNKLLRRWLWPPASEKAWRTNLIGLAIVVALMVFWVVFFILMTRVFWHLP